MGLLPSDGKWPRSTEPAAGAGASSGDLVIECIEELGKRYAGDARAEWHKQREARFAELLHDDFEQLHDMMERLATATKKPATLRKYAQHFTRFKKFARECFFDGYYGMSPLPSCPALVVDFLRRDLLDGKAYSQIKQACAGISDAHTTNKLPDPTQTLEAKAMLRLCRQYAGQFPKAGPNGKESEQAKPNGKGHSEPKEAADEGR